MHGKCKKVMDELELFINKIIKKLKKIKISNQKVIFDEKIFSASLPSVSKFCNPHTFFPFNLDTF
jgi:hypothetical protein